jgi:hypothetical protein
MKAKTITSLMTLIFCWINTVQGYENREKISSGYQSNELKGSSQITESITVDEPGKRGGRENGMETLSGDNSHSGGYGALFFKGSSFKNTSILMMGIRGAWVVNRSFGLGIDLNGLIPVSKYDDADPVGISDAILLGGYGGLLLEPVVWSKKLVHVTFPISIGAGAEVNVTNYFRIDVGISKRFTQDLSLYNTPSDAFDKLNYSLTLKFGGF